ENRDTNTTFNAGTDVVLAGVKVTLFVDTNSTGGLDAGDVQVATGTTDANGAYSFTGLAPGNYIVRIDQSNFEPGGALENQQGPALSLAGSPDPDNNVDNDDNGIPVTGQGVGSLPITLAYNTEPSAGSGNDTNTTLDFGFAFIPPNQPPVVVAD